MAGGGKKRGSCAVMALCLALGLALPLRPAAQGHSATKAMLLSLAPGAGQVYNRQAWKVPVIYGAFAGMGYLVYDNYKSMKMFRDEYLYRVQHSGATRLEGYGSYSTQNIYSLYNSYNQQFQLMIIITAGIYALNLIDAYVFGHLFDFQIGDDIALVPSAVPTAGGPAAGLGLTISF